uniref:C2H2-type domain-containing protein n=1 Tax=Macaca fascicularis TaxID=9541 RepID=A0A7N9IDN7_MACFA
MVQRLCESKEGSQYGQVVSHIPNLDLNENISTGLKQCECSICGKVFVHHSLLNRHILAHSGYKPYGEKQYKCEQCGKLFVSVPGVRRHRIMHSGNPAYKCTICGKAFHFLNSVERHQRTHTGEKPYKCKQCGKAFTVSGSCLIHGRTHTGEKPYECKECGKTLRFSCFKMHERTHTGERCTKCDKAFSCSTSLHDHGSIHTGERPYECKQCGKAFSCLSSLCNHRSTHTGEKPYECKQCDQAFSRLSSLHLHERIHTGEKPYEYVHTEAVQAALAKHKEWKMAVPMPSKRRSLVVQTSMDAYTPPASTCVQPDLADVLQRPWTRAALFHQCGIRELPPGKCQVMVTSTRRHS